jgi:hypothetical protein
MSDEKPTKKKATPKKKAVVHPPLGNMLIVGNQLISNTGQVTKTFSCIPVDLSCPYLECLFDPAENMLGIISVNTKDTLQQVTKLDNKGLPKRNQDGNTMQQAPFFTERIVMNAPQEYYIRDKEEISAFLTMVAVNPEFNWEECFSKPLTKEK